MALELGSTLGPYEIVGLLGAGGMGEVYRAVDSRLGRDVAIKSLPHAVANDQDRLRRFRSEARAVAALNHPNVCTLHEIGRENGFEYLVMELVEGRPLSELLATGSLPLDQVIHYGIQIADALTHAHDHQIVHRDLKTANVMVTSNARIKVVDFGLARQLPREDLTALTQSAPTLEDRGSIAGTLPYMPPEVFRGAQVDARGDIWALGVMLYEMAAGRRPFSGRTGIEVASAILRDPPGPLAGETPAGLAGIINRCLIKDPAQRCQRASDVRAALEAIASTRAGTQAPSQSPLAVFNVRLVRWTAGAVLIITLAVAGLMVVTRTSAPAGEQNSKVASIAVLPFQSVGVRDDVKFLEVGIPDAIINRLAAARQLRVRPTNAILRYEGHGVSIREAGQTLEAEYILTGTLQPAGERLRVSVQLVHATDETSLWGEHYDIDRQELVTLQDRIAAEVATALPIRMSAAERERLNPRYARNPEAFELDLRGRTALVRYTPESTRAAVSAFEKAIQIDPRDALAHAGLASASAQMRIRFAPETELQSWLDRAQKEAAAALELDQNLAEAHEARAAVARHIEFDWDLVINESDRALALNPSLEQPHFYRAAAFYHWGLFDRAREEIRLGMAANPVSRVEPLRLLGTTALLGSQFVEGESALRSAQALTSNAVTSTYLAQALYNLGRKGEAEEILTAATASDSAQARRRAQATLASYLAARKEHVKARALVNDVLAGPYMDHHVAYSLGIAFAHIGDRVEARRWLTRAAREGFPCYPWYTQDPLIQLLQSDPPFQELIDQLHAQFDGYRTRYAR